MKKIVGLTDNPEIEKKKNGDPYDWWQRVFNDEQEANKWLNLLIKNYGFKNVTTNGSWRYGFTFSPVYKKKTV